MNTTDIPAGFKITPPTDQGVRHIIQNMRAVDRLEFEATHGADVSTETIAQMLMAGGEWRPTWMVREDHDPVALFGYVPRSRYVVEGWSFGTVRMTRAMTIMTPFIRSVLPARWQDEGVRACEVRTLETHTQAHAWLHGIGFRCVGTLKGEGAHGENFELYAWRLDWTKGAGHG